MSVKPPTTAQIRLLLAVIESSREHINWDSVKSILDSDASPEALRKRHYDLKLKYRSAGHAYGSPCAFAAEEDEGATAPTPPKAKSVSTAGKRKRVGAEASTTEGNDGSTIEPPVCSKKRATKRGKAAPAAAATKTPNRGNAKKTRTTKYLKQFPRIAWLIPHGGS
ncbi:hypothetical protein L228DRAFT_284527 [Xylona heveae TC161]|uniref:Uncharacterized protein n=1 Tax=Xylona heveae (strain CBS 132557 / TC161) TaxID=1328760 RepID=A0A165AJ48_XYLHT|nr:hypothetical protein L228DRAFT_284527 [Xylona heveae TC161]KZF20564.1 hypothetical protein L228DRAFT_284527 [Xylona heveae TC161]